MIEANGLTKGLRWTCGLLRDFADRGVAQDTDQHFAVPLNRQSRG